MHARLITKTDFYAIYQDSSNFYVQAGDYIKSLPVATAEQAEEYVIENYYELIEKSL